MTAWVASVGALQFESGVRSSAANDPHRHQPSGLRRHRRHLPLCSVGYEAERTEKGEVHIWLEERWINKLKALRGPGESYTDVIVRLAGVGHESLNGS